MDTTTEATMDAGSPRDGTTASRAMARGTSHPTSPPSVGDVAASPSPPPSTPGEGLFAALESYARRDALAASLEVLRAERATIDERVFQTEAELNEAEEEIARQKASHSVDELFAIIQSQRLEILDLRRAAEASPTPPTPAPVVDEPEEDGEAHSSRYDVPKLFLEGYASGYQLGLEGGSSSTVGMRSYRKDGFKAGYEDAAAGLPARAEELVKPYARKVRAKIQERRARDRRSAEDEASLAPPADPRPDHDDADHPDAEPSDADLPDDLVPSAGLPAGPTDGHGRDAVHHDGASPPRDEPPTRQAVDEALASDGGPNAVGFL